MRTEHVEPVTVDELPETLEPGKLYLDTFGDAEPHVAVMLCPCGCGGKCHMPLNVASHPSWRCRVESGAVTLTPSVHRIRGCRSHFFVRENRIVWV